MVKKETNNQSGSLHILKKKKKKKTVVVYITTFKITIREGQLATTVIWISEALNGYKPILPN